MRHPHRQAKPFRRMTTARAAFTLIEVLAAMLLIAIVMPVVMQGITASGQAGSAARYRTQAAILADSKLSELTVTGQWDGGAMSGDFGAVAPGYRWQATVAEWAGDTQGIGLQQLDVQVTWTARGRPSSVSVNGLVYVRPVPST